MDNVDTLKQIISELYEESLLEEMSKASDVRDFVLKNPSMNAKQVAVQLGVSVNDASSAMSRLRSAGLLPGGRAQKEQAPQAPKTNQTAKPVVTPTKPKQEPKLKPVTPTKPEVKAPIFKSDLVEKWWYSRSSSTQRNFLALYNKAGSIGKWQDWFWKDNKDSNWDDIEWAKFKGITNIAEAIVYMSNQRIPQNLPYEICSADGTRYPSRNIQSYTQYIRVGRAKTWNDLLKLYKLDGVAIKPKPVPDANKAWSLRYEVPDYEHPGDLEHQWSDIYDALKSAGVFKDVSFDEEVGDGRSDGYSDDDDADDYGEEGYAICIIKGVGLELRNKVSQALSSMY